MFFPGKKRFYPILNFEADIFSSLQLLSLWQRLGLTYYQLRAKNTSPSDYMQAAKELKAAFSDLHIIANDHAKVALEHPDIFSGLHLGQEDFASLGKEMIKALTERTGQRFPEREEQGRSYLLGLSTHNSLQIQTALDPNSAVHLPWSYLALGPCFPTSSKPQGKDPVLSREEFIKAVTAFMALPFEKRPALVLIGGIEAANLQRLLTRLLVASTDIAPEKRVKPSVAAIGVAREQGQMEVILQLLNRANFSLDPVHGT